MTCLAVLSLACGYLAHCLRRFTDRISLQIWREQANRVLGVVLVFPLALAFFRRAQGEDDERFTVAFSMAFLMFGLGNTAARFWDGLKRG